MMKNALLLAGFFLMFGCHVESVREDADRHEDPIVGGGSPFKALQAAVIQLEVKKGAVTGGCSSTLIAADLLLTAKHCLGTQRSAVIGGVKYPTIAFRTHATMDLVVLRLTGDLPGKLQRLGYSPIKLHDEKPGSLVDTDLLTVAGYGIRESTVANFGVLRSGTMSFLRFLSSYNGLDVVYQNGLELAPSPSTACHGDSGGPILQERGVEGLGIIGVVSTGTDTKGLACDPSKNIVVADVRPLRAWLLQR